MAQKTVRDLLVEAKTETTEPHLRHEAIRTLLKHCQVELEADFQYYPERYAGHDNPFTFWRECAHRLADKGILLSGCNLRVCCERRDNARVGLRDNSRVRKPLVPVLPLHDQQSVGGRLAEGVSHAFEFIALPSDYLHSTCQQYFQRLALDTLALEDIQEWCHRMQCFEHGGDEKQMRAFLSAEQQRICNRSRAMDFAAAGDYEHFVELLPLELFEREAVTMHMKESQRQVFKPECFRNAPEVSGSQFFSRSFGVRSRTGEWWAGAVPRLSNPCSWMHYTGRPGYCSTELWHHRAFVKARGGYCESSVPLLNELRRLEALRDPNYVFVKWHHPMEALPSTSIQSCMVGEAYEVHALSIWPRDIPDAKTWLGICSRPNVNVRVLRDYIFDERESHGIVFSLYEGRCELTGDYAAASATVKNKAESWGRHYMQKWAARSVNDWVQWYNDRQTGTDNGGVSQVSLAGGLGKFFLSFCVLLV